MKPKPVRLYPPDEHVISNAKVPNRINGPVRIRFERRFQMTAFPQGIYLREIDGAVRDGVQRLVLRGGVLLAPPAALHALHGAIPGPLPRR